MMRESQPDSAGYKDQHRYLGPVKHHQGSQRSLAEDLRNRREIKERLSVERWSSYQNADLDTPAGIRRAAALEAVRGRQDAQQMSSSVLSVGRGTIPR